MSISANTTDTDYSAHAMLQQFRSLRRSFLFWRLIDVVARTTAFTLVSLAAVILLDLYFPLPWQLRAGIVAAFLVVFAIALYRIFQCFSSPPSFASLARSITTDRGEQQSNLIALGMLLEQSEKSTKVDRNTLSATRYAQSVLQGWSWHRSVDRSQPLQWSLLATGLLIGYLVAITGPNFPLLQHRWFGLFKSQQASNYLLQITNAPRYVYSGESIDVEVRSAVTLPQMDDIELQVDGEFESIRKLSAAGESTTRFQIVAIESPLTIRAVAGSKAFSHNHRIDVRQPSKVDSHVFKIAPPDYLSQSTFESNKAELTVARDSNVTLQIELTNQNHLAQLHVISEYRDSLTLAPSTRQNGFNEFNLTQLTRGQSSRTNKASETETIQIECVAIDTEGIAYPLNYPLSLSVLSDQLPTFTELNAQSVKDSANDYLVTSTVTDDHGLLSVAITYQGISTSSKKIDPSLQQVDELFIRDSTIADTTNRVPIASQFSLSELRSRWPTCDAVDINLTATDNASQLAKSPALRIALYDPSSKELQVVQAASDIVRQQKQLQQQTDQASSLTTLQQQLLDRLSESQEEIIEQWKNGLLSEQEANAQQSRLQKSISQLMRASQQNLANGQLIEASNIQQVLIEKLNDFARSSQATKSDTASEQTSPKDLRSNFIDWQKRQQAVLDTLKGPAGNIDEKQVAADEQTLQQEIEQARLALDHSSHWQWPMSQVISLLGRVNAKLSRGRFDSSVTMDASLASDILGSLARMESEVSQDDKEPSQQEQQPQDNPDPQMSLALQELRLVRDLQIALRDRLKATASTPAASSTSPLEIQAIAELQSVLADRTRALSEALK